MAGLTVIRNPPILFVALVVHSLCASAVSVAQESNLSDYAIAQFGKPPPIPDGDLSDELQDAVRIAFIESVKQSVWGQSQSRALSEIVESGDPRIAWTITDMMRFTWQPDLSQSLADAAASLLHIELKTHKQWGELTDYLIAWNIPSYPGYLPAKRTIFTRFVPGWERIFVEGDIDWRFVSWGGVLIDDPPFDPDDVCNCIPAADNPEVSSADQATWLKDDDIVFGIAINGEARAYPRRIMEVREMVNDTLGGRDLGIPYCTLCGAAQAYFTDQMPDGVARPVLRTSGLLIRSNKVMYDVNTYSVFDTFLGHAVTGSLAEKGIKLKQASVVTTDWASWKKAYPKNYRAG